MQNKTAIIIGGGAAGFFCAINAARNFPGYKLIILEKSNKFLSKVKISGGGRCNVTHSTFDNRELVKNYPRGEKTLHQVFAQFSVEDTIQWFESRGVQLKTETDGRIFPVSDESQTIINLFLNAVDQCKIEARLNEKVLSINRNAEHGITVQTQNNQFYADAVVCSVGGFRNIKDYDFIKQCGHTITEIAPSLFTLNIESDRITELSGISVKNIRINFSGSKFEESGDILITHWGFSGPAVLRLSAFAAFEFLKQNYTGTITINWAGKSNEETVINNLMAEQSNKIKVTNMKMYTIPRRLWEYLLLKGHIDVQKYAYELSKKEIHRLAKIITSDTYQINGKTTFKEEFVTAGGVNEKEINYKTMESKIFPKLFFCGEVLNVDAVTGGYNFQSAWSTAWIAAKNLF